MNRVTTSLFRHHSKRLRKGDCSGHRPLGQLRLGQVEGPRRHAFSLAGEHNSAPPLFLLPAFCLTVIEPCIAHERRASNGSPAHKGPIRVARSLAMQRSIGGGAFRQWHGPARSRRRHCPRLRGIRKGRSHALFERPRFPFASQPATLLQTGVATSSADRYNSAL